MDKFKGVVKFIKIIATTTVTFCSAFGTLANSVDEIKQMKSTQQRINIC